MWRLFPQSFIIISIAVTEVSSCYFIQVQTLQQPLVCNRIGCCPTIKSYNCKFFFLALVNIALLINVVWHIPILTSFHVHSPQSLCYMGWHLVSYNAWEFSKVVHKVWAGNRPSSFWQYLSKQNSSVLKWTDLVCQSGLP